MRFYSTKNKSLQANLKEAVLRGLAPNGGLFMPLEIPLLPQNFLKNLKGLSFKEAALEMAKPFLRDDFSLFEIEQLIERAFPFSAPLQSLTDNLHVLELFHGPTLAFKDFGAQFMAALTERFTQKQDQELTVLVATSGDTGSAVAHGFYRKQGVRVVLLYPSGMVSEIQEKQLTTLGANVTALEIEGTFDDCQWLVKQAFNDADLRQKLLLTSANSINIARLLPQSFYYAYAVAQLPEMQQPIVISVPSGNLGNLTGGLLAQRMGIPVSRFVSAMNTNDVFMEYLQTGRLRPRIVRPTLSNAMDVGNPSNFYRILDLFDQDHEKIKNAIYGASFTDEETRLAIKQAYEKFSYIFDPHSAVGFLAMEKFRTEMPANKWQGIILETAHPAKFKPIVEQSGVPDVPVPYRLAATLNKEKKAIKFSKSFDDFKEWLLNF